MERMRVMKRLVGMVLCLCVLVGVTMSLAQGAEKTKLGTLNVNGAFDLKGTIPDGYALNIEIADTTMIRALIESDDKAKPHMSLTIAFSELIADVDRLNDLNNDQLTLLEQTFKAEDDVEISYRNTDHGTKLMIVEAKDKYIVFYTIYKGYEIEFLLTPGTSPMTDAQINMVIGFLSDLDFDSAE